MQGRRAGPAQVAEELHEAVSVILAVVTRRAVAEFDDDARAEAVALTERLEETVALREVTAHYWAAQQVYGMLIEWCDAPGLVVQLHLAVDELGDSVRLFRQSWMLDWPHLAYWYSRLRVAIGRNDPADAAWAVSMLHELPPDARRILATTSI